MILEKFFKNRAWLWSHEPLIFRVLNANSSKMVKATDFKFDMHVFGDSPDVTPLKFFNEGASVKIHLAEICTLTSGF